MNAAPASWEDFSHPYPSFYDPAVAVSDTDRQVGSAFRLAMHLALLAATPGRAPGLTLGHGKLPQPMRDELELEHAAVRGYRRGQHQAAGGDAILLALYLVGAATQTDVAHRHNGSFRAEGLRKRGERGLTSHIDDLMRGSSYLTKALGDGTLRMIVIHDLPELLPFESHRNVTLHRLRDLVLAVSQPHDKRWEAYGEALRDAGAKAADCVFAIDFGDVAPTRDPRELCEAAPGALFVGSDNCASPGAITNGAKFWLRKACLLSRYAASASLRAYLYTPSSAAFNSGVIGGTHTVFDAFRRAVAHRTRAHYAASASRGESPSPAPVDMLVVNDMALTWSGPVVTGFPDGPVNMPMFGNLCAPWNPCEPDCDAPLDLTAARLRGKVLRCYDVTATRPILDAPPPRRPTLALEPGRPIHLILPDPSQGASARQRGKRRRPPQGAAGGPPLEYVEAPGHGLLVSGVPRVDAAKLNRSAGGLFSERDRSLCYRRALREMVPHYYFRHKLFCGRVIPC